SGSRVTLKLLSVDAEYLDREPDPATLLDDGFKRSESELSATWRISAKSTLDARLARVEQRSNHFAQRSFSGNTGRLDYRWAASPKLALEAAFSRALEPWSELQASYR